MSQTGTKDSRTNVPLTHLGNRWAENFSPGWSYQPRLKISLISDAKNIGTKVKFQSGSKVISALMLATAQRLLQPAMRVRIPVDPPFHPMHCLTDLFFFFFTKLPDLFCCLPI